MVRSWCEGTIGGRSWLQRDSVAPLLAGEGCSMALVGSLLAEEGYIMTGDRSLVAAEW